MPTDHNSSPVRKYAIFIVVGCVAVVALIGGYHAWQTHQEAARLEAEAKAGPHVDIAEAKMSPPERTISLVGEARPYASVTLYAKVSGYLKTVKVDKGDKVKKDQLLAVIESPEIDKEYMGALADAKNKRAISGRMSQLRGRNLVSPQEADQAESDAAVAESKLDSLAVQKGYETLRAPFDGTVTSRFVDAGALVQNAANSQTSAQPVVTVSQVNRLRVYVYVDQRDASYIKMGEPAKVNLTEQRDLELKATVSRVSGELDPKTKLMLTEIDVDNKEGKVVPGSFVQVTLVIHTPELLELPVQALMMREGKSLLGIVDQEDFVHFREVQIGDNDGKFMTVRNGLQTGEKVALNLGNNFNDGGHVRPNAKKGAEPEKKPEGVKPAVTTPAPASETPPASAPAAPAATAPAATSEASGK